MYEKAKFVCLNYMQQPKVKFKSVQINMKHVSYHYQTSLYEYIGKHWAPRGFGDLGRMTIYFQGAEEHGNYFQGFGEQAHSFCGFREPYKNVFKKSHLKEKPSFCLFFSKKNKSASGGGAPQTPWTSKCIYFCGNMLI